MSIRMDTSSTTQMAELMVKHWISCGASLTKLVWSPTCWSRVGKTIWRRFFWTWMGEITELDCMFVYREQGFISLWKCGWHRNRWKEAPMWKKLVKHVDIDEPTSFLDHVYLGCTQRECKPNETIVEQFKKMFESGISAVATAKITGMGKTSRTNSSVGPTTWKDMLKKCVGAIQLENCQKFAHKLSWNACTWARIGRPDIRWSVNNKHARSVTKKWTQACDRRLARLISYIHHTNDFRQCCHVGTHGTALQTGFVSRLRLGWWSWGNQLQEVSSVFLEVEHLFPSGGCSRNKLLSRRVPQSPKSSLWTLDWD